MPTTPAASSFDVLRAYLLARAPLSDEELELVRATFVPAHLRADEYFQLAGVVATHAAFVARGCLRTYVIDDGGSEHIVSFAAETWWVADNASLASGAPSQFFIDAVEDSELLLIDPQGHERLVEQVPGYAASFRRGLQRHAAAKDQRIVSALSASAEERYLQFLETYPTIAARVPQKMLASSLGMSPETVSRIRRRLAGK
jgi:CRP-like cAMP-binding protein